MRKKGEINNNKKHTMKKTFYTLGALIISASMVFTACGNSSNDSTETNAVAADSTSVILAPAGSIVYVDMSRIASEYQMNIDLGTETQKKIEEMAKKVESKKKSIETELKRKEEKLTKAANEFQEKLNKGLFTQSVAESKAQEISQMEIEYNQYGAQKEQELQQEVYNFQLRSSEEELVWKNTVNDAINTFIIKYNQEKKYAMILMSYSDVPNDGVTNLGSPVLTADPALDITTDVLAGLNAEYKASK